MFKREHKRRSNNVVFVVFRLILSVVMFIVLLAGIYTAYKHFSGLDPLKLDPIALVNSLVAGKVPPEASQILTKIRFNPNLLGKTLSTNGQLDSLNSVQSTDQPETAELSFRFLLISDSHTSTDNLTKALDQAKASYPDIKFIIGLGDYSDIGTIEQLQATKKVLDGAAIRYFLVPGDHDLWDCRNRNIEPNACFREVFGPSYQSFIFNNFDFLLLNDSDNYNGFDNGQLTWITNELERTKTEQVNGIFVFMHETLYHPSSDHVMGWVEKTLKPQADMLLFQLKDAKATRIFAGHVHYFSDYIEPRTNLPMITIGALAINDNPQAPRFGVVSVYVNGTVRVEDVEIK